MRANYTLSEEDIEKIRVLTDRYVKKNGAQEHESLVLNLMLEETLLILRERFGEQTAVRIRLQSSLQKITCTLSVKEEEFDPFSVSSIILDRLIQTYGDKPVWEYIKGVNVVTFGIALNIDYLSNIKFAWKYTRPYKGQFGLAVAFQLVYVVLSVIAPILSSKIIVAYTDSAIEQIFLTALAILVINVMMNLSLFLCNTVYNKVYSKLLSGIETDLADSSLKIKSSCMDQKGSGLFIQRLTVDTNTLATGFNTVADYILQMFRYIGIMAAMLIVSPSVFAIVLVLLILQTLVEIVRTRQMKEDDRLYRLASERFSGLVSEMVRGSSDIKLLNSEAALKDELQDRIKDTNDKRMNMILKSWKFKIASSGVNDVGRFVFMCLLAVLIARFGMAPSKALVLFNYYTEIGVSVVLVLGQMLEFVKAFSLSAERVGAILDSEAFAKESFGSTKLEKICGDIRFDNVSFRYDSNDPRISSKDVLKNMSFEIKPGTTVALVGRSGCGKSTTLRLITKLYEPQSGKILIDGNDITMLDKESIRGNMTFVSQKPYLFHMTIRENLRLIKPDMTEEEMKEACRIACIDEDIELMPQGYDTLIGEGGINLSGGQRQRLAIARCLLKDFDVILLDEATSALDNITQQKIQTALDNLHGSRTIIMIAHRLSTVINSDKILFIEDGKILDEGTHEQLMERCSSYQDLYRAE